MDTTHNTNTDNRTRRASLGSAFHEILQECHTRRVVIRRRSGEKIFNCSVLLALILSIGAPILLGLVLLGVWVESIRVSIEKV
jgi:hypothetical protein